MYQKVVDDSKNLLDTINVTRKKLLNIMKLIGETFVSNKSKIIPESGKLYIAQGGSDEKQEQKGKGLK